MSQCVLETRGELPLLPRGLESLRDSTFIIRAGTPDGAAGANVALLIIYARVESRFFSQKETETSIFGPFPDVIQLFGPYCRSDDFRCVIKQIYGAINPAVSSARNLILRLKNRSQTPIVKARAILAALRSIALFSRTLFLPLCAIKCSRSS